MGLDTKIVPTGPRFDINTDVSAGLALLVNGGTFLDGLGYRSAPNVLLTLTASATNYVECSDAGAITANTTGFTDSATPLYVVTTNATAVTGIEDRRGSAQPTLTQNMTANGAIRPDAEFVTLSKSGVLAATIAAPVPGRKLTITQIDAGTDGHTVTLAAGTWNGTNAIATFNAANKTLVVQGVTATRFAVIANVGTVTFSG